MKDYENKNKLNLGQVWTPKFIVQKYKNLIKSYDAEFEHNFNNKLLNNKKDKLKK
ncbi:hypothetical protein [Mycoplasmopsis californica]|uniref:hypothetical protein n=1 Tax=Mycoplasmopsis californica TaxID=2113 RepID=UPI000A96D513|nr:hypothetical protein [Mycoplasmopsis californica]